MVAPVLSSLLYRLSGQEQSEARRSQNGDAATSQWAQLAWPSWHTIDVDLIGLFARAEVTAATAAHPNLSMGTDVDDGFMLPPPLIGEIHEFEIFSAARRRRAALEVSDEEVAPDVAWTSSSLLRTRRCASRSIPSTPSPQTNDLQLRPRVIAQMLTATSDNARDGPSPSDDRRLLKAALLYWAQSVAAARRIPVEFLPPGVRPLLPQTLRKNHQHHICMRHQSFAATRPPLGCRQAVRVGRRRIAVQRVSRSSRRLP